MATGRIGVTPTLGTRWSKAPAGGTTSLSGLDDNSVSLVYSVGYEQVYRNGVLLSRGNDYTATTGNSITLIDATIAGDIIEVFANELVPLTDAISKGQFTAKGALLSATAASTPAVLTVGSNDQVLTADSTTSTGLKWATPAAGGMTLISTTTMSGSTVTLSSIPATYKHLQILIKDIDPTDDADYCDFRLNSDSTANRHKYVSVFSGGAAQTFGATAIRILSEIDNAANDGFVIINIYDYANTTTFKSGQFYGFANDATTSTNVNMTAGYFLYNQTAAISSLQFISVFNTWAGGTIELYGVK